MKLQEDLPSATKLLYLKSHLKGRALALIDNLPIENAGLSEAYKILKTTFLDLDVITDNLIQAVVEYKQCRSLEDCQSFVDLLRSKLLDLDQLGFDFQGDGKGNSGPKFMAHFVRKKLYPPFLMELSKKVSSVYPSVPQIFENAAEIYTLLKKGEDHLKKEPHSVKPKETFQQQKPKAQYIQQNSKVSKSQYYGGCKFCLSLEHSSTHYKKYSGHEERVRRASQLNLCTLCFSPKHSKERCYGRSEELSFGCKSCLSKGHVTPLCPKMVLSLTATKVVESKGSKK